MPTLTHKQVREYVARHEPFQANNIFAENIFYPDPLAMSDRYGAPARRLLYVVYSYRRNWPLLIFDSVAGQWFVNVERYSSTTTRHLALMRPTSRQTEINNETALQLITDGGYAQYVAAKMKGRS